MSRALYKNSPIILLDEPTASLDPLAENSLYQSFNKIVSKKLAIFISHRLSSTRFCDKILLFENGSIIETGTHNRLMDSNGKYKVLFEIQAQYYKEKKQKIEDGIESVINIE